MSYYDPSQGQNPNLPGGVCGCFPTRECLERHGLLLDDGEYRTGDLYEYLPPYIIGKKIGGFGKSAEQYVEQKLKKPEEDFMNAVKTIGIVAVVVVGGLALISILKK